MQSIIYIIRIKNLYFYLFESIHKYITVKIYVKFKILKNHAARNKKH
jgi:hypothetical protein